MPRGFFLPPLTKPAASGLSSPSRAKLGSPAPTMNDHVPPAQADAAFSRETHCLRYLNATATIRFFPVGGREGGDGAAIVRKHVDRLAALRRMAARACRRRRVDRLLVAAQ